MEAMERVLAFLTGRKTAYQMCFPREAAPTKIVLADLSKFCRANETCVVPGDRDRSLILEGRREVWLRLQQHLHLTPEQLAQLYTSPTKPEN